MIFIVAKRFLGSEYSFLIGDLDSQFVLVDRMFWRHLLRGEGLSFSFNYSMGLPTAALYAVLEMSPFGIIHAFIQDAELASLFIYLLKLMAASAAFWFFSVNTLKSDEKKAVLFATIYALSSYTLHFYMNLHFLDVVYITPLLIWAIIRFIDTGRRGWLIIIYAYSFLNIFLTGYNLGIFSFVVFLSLLYVRKINGNLFAKKMLSFLLSVVAAVLISMIVIIPATLFFLQHMPDGSSFSVTESMRPWEFLISFLPARKALVFNSLPALYCGIPIPLLVVLYFLDTDNSNRERIAASFPLAFLLICTFWHPAYLLMHAFDEPDSFAFRFSYLWVFYLVSIAALEFVRIVRRGTVKLLSKAFWIVTVPYAVLFLLLRFTQLSSERPSVQQWGGSVVLLIIYVSLLSRLNTKKEESIGEGKESDYPDDNKDKCNLKLLNVLMLVFMCIWVAEVVISGGVSLRNLRMDNDTLRVNVQNRVESTKILKAFYDEIENQVSDVFFRVDLPASYTSNEMMELGIHGTGYFSSIENSVLRKELYALGYQGRPQFVPGRGSTEFTRMIFDNKYTIDKDYQKTGINQFIITKHSQVLPIAFMVSDNILNYKAEGDNPFVNQNRLAEAMIGETAEIYYSKALGASLSGVTVSSLEDGFTYLVMDEDSEGLAVVEFLTESDSKGSDYMYLSQEKTYAEEFEGASLMPAAIGGDWAGVGYSLFVPGIVPMEKYDDGYSVATLILQREPGSVVFYKNAYCVGTNSDVLQEVYKELLPGQLQLTSFSNTRIEGKVNVQENMPILYTSIPYDKGWHIMVDGEKAETVAIMDEAFLAAKLSPGEHEIVFYYRNQGLIIGLCCTIAGLMIFVFLMWKEKRNCKKTCED